MQAERLAPALDVEIGEEGPGGGRIEPDPEPDDGGPEEEPPIRAGEAEGSEANSREAEASN
jgi:hypothetical protein